MDRTEIHITNTLSKEAILSDLKAFASPGGFVPEEIGIHRMESSAEELSLGLPQRPSGPPVILPTPAFRRIEYDLDGYPNLFFVKLDETGQRQLLFIDPETEEELVPFYQSDGRTIVLLLDIEDLDQAAKELSAISCALTEGSFIDGFSDLLISARLALVYHVAQREARPTLITEGLGWTKKREIFANYLQENNDIASHFFLPLIGDDVIKTIGLLQITLESLQKGDLERSREFFKQDPRLLTTIEAYFYALLKSDYGEQVLGDASTIKQTALTLAKVESAPDVIDSFFSATQSKFSTYLDLVLDLTTRQLAPTVFAFGNKGLAIAVGMPNQDYLTRMRATRTNVDFTQLVNSLLDPSGEQKLTTAEIDERMSTFLAPKSIYTAVSEALNKALETSDTDKTLLTLTEAQSQLPQMARDFERVQAFDALLQKWKDNQTAPEEEKFILEVYKNVLETPDACRGSLLPDNSDMDQLVENAYANPDVHDVIAVLNYHDEAGGHPLIRNLRSLEERQAFAQELGLPLFATPSQIVNRWYELYEGKYPYGAIHLFAKARLYRSLFRNAVEAGDQSVELRIIPKEHEREAYESRIPFKWYESKHVRPGETG